MKIEFKTEDKKLQIKLNGRLDTTTAPELENVLKEKLNEIDFLIFDFEQLEYISSAGLRILLSSQKIMNKQGKMKVINVNQDIMNVFEITGFIDILCFE